VELQGVRKVYPNGFEAVKCLDLAIGDGELIVLVGPSGCGKSTLLRMIAGLEGITEGVLRIDGQLVNDIEPSHRDIAMVFQNYALYPHMSVAKNMGYGLRNRGEDKAVITEKVQRVAEILEIESFLDRKPSKLSGGQRQRVAMGRAIVRDPKVFLFDEPLSNLDAKLRVQMRIEIKKLQRRLGTTAIYVTHDQVEAMTLADRLVVLNAGGAEQIGSPMEVFERPASTFVGGFIGSPPMNLLPTECGDGALRIGGHSIVLAGGAAPANGSATLGVRPDHFSIAARDAADFDFTVDMIEPLGSSSLVYGRIVGVEQEIVVTLGAKEKVDLGDVLPLVLDSSQLSLFDGATGRRIN
jgi:sn-glycerol 3-phosphate transport system ATP-binding protein